MLPGTVPGYGTPDSLLPKRKHIRRGRALGTNVTFTIFHADKKTADLAIDEALAKIEHVEQLMSLYRPDSQLSILNRKGVLRNPHPDLLAVLRKAKEISKLTQGAFDVTVQPLWKLYVDCSRAGAFTSGGRLPTENEIQTVRQRVGWQHIHLQRDLICMNKAGVQVTLNGMAQGLAADMAQQALKTRGIEHALIDAGEFNAIGQPLQKDAWHIAIKHNRKPAERLCKTELRDRCLSTSGDYGTRFSENYRHHHLFDPRTGLSPTEISSVSVIAPNALDADALSTAIFILGVDKGRDLVESMDHVDALFVTRSGHIEQTKGFAVL
jgi:thiamine biosynthesis lipoprotein